MPSKFAKVARKHRERSSPRLVTSTRRGRPSTPHLRERILASATDLFSQQDFDLVSIDDVATLARVGKGSVYRQFGSKEELYATAIIDGLRALQTEIGQSLSDADSLRDRIRTVVFHILNFFWHRLQFFTLLRDPQALPRRVERRYDAERNNLVKLVREVVSAGVAEGKIRADIDTKIAAETILGMMRGINRYCRDYIEPSAAAHYITAMFLDGCAAERQPPSVH